MKLRVIVVAGAVLALAATGCAGSSSKTSPSEPTTTTLVTGNPADPVFAKRGPYAAGVTTRQLPDGRKVEVWYPAPTDAVKGKAPDSYALSAWLPQSVTSRIPPDQSPVYETHAYRDVPAAPGRFPLVVFSHGVLSFRDQSTFLTDHLASWGMVVMAPDHLERAIATIFEPVGRPVDDVGDLARTIDLASAEDAHAGGALQGHIDTGRIGAVGHSAGGNAVLELGARDPRVEVVVSLTTPLRDAASWPAGKPVMFLAGTADQIIPSGSVTTSYEQLTSTPRRLVLIAGLGHLAFSEFCELGKDQGGILQIAARNGIELSATVLRLGSDGCNPPDLDPVAAWPVINNFTTAQLSNTFGLNPDGVGLGDGVQNRFPGVSVEYRQAV